FRTPGRCAINARLSNAPAARILADFTGAGRAPSAAGPGARQPCQGLPSVFAGGGVLLEGGVVPPPSADAVVEPITGAAARMQRASRGPPNLSSFSEKDMTNPFDEW